MDKIPKEFFARVVVPGMVDLAVPAFPHIKPSRGKYPNGT